MGDGITISTLLDSTGFEKGSQKLRSAVKSLSNSVKSVGQRSFNDVLNGAKRLIPTLIGVSSAYGIISRAVSTFMSQNLRLQRQMSAVWTSLGNLLGPVISEIVGWVTTAVSYFLSFLKLLGVTSKTASQLSKAANSAAGGLSRTVAGFDELNKLQTGGTGAGRLEDKDPTVFMQKLVELLKNKLWDDVADLIIDKIDGLIATGKEKAEELGEKLSEYLYAAFHIIGRVVNEVDWGGIGETVANFINGLFSDERISGEDLGKILVGKLTIAFKAITGFFETVDLGRIAEIASGAVIGMLDALTKAIEEADFNKIGQNIRDFFSNIDWKGIAESVKNLLISMWKAAVDGLKNFLTGDDDSGMSDGVATVLSKLIIGGGVALTAGAGINSTIKNLISGNELIGKLAEHLKNSKSATEDVADAAKKAADAASNAGDGTKNLGNKTSGMTTKMTSLVKNLGLGLVALLEVAAAAVLFVAAVWAIGELLQQVVEAWQPVIDNAGTAAIAVLTSAGLMAALGVVCAALGGSGATIATQIGIGMAILVEIGIAVGLFLVEVWGIGEGLQEIIEAWQPVLDNADTVEAAIVQGSGLLLAIGVACAALGALTVASAGALPIAIGLGTAMLAGIAEATKLFIQELASVAAKLRDDLAPELSSLNEVLPDLSDNMTDFVDYMEEFAEEVVRYTKSTGIVSLKEIGTKIRDFFLGDPIENMVDEAERVYESIVPLNDTLDEVNPELEEAVNLLTDYTGFLERLEELTTGNYELSNGIFVNMQEVGSNLVAGFVDGIQSNAESFASAATTLTDGFNEALNEGMTKAVDEYVKQCNNLSATTANVSDRTEISYQNIANTVSSNMATAERSMSSAYTGMESSSVTSLSNIWGNFYNTFSTLVSNTRVWGADLIQNFVNGLADRVGVLWQSCVNIAQGIRNILGFSEPKEGPLSNFHTYAPDMIDLFTKGIDENKDKTLDAVSELAGGISDEIQNGEYSFGEIGAPEMGDFMDGFADKVVNGFSDMVSRMQEIADSVVFSMPVVAGGGFLPYNVGSSSSNSLDATDENSQVLIAIQQLQDSITKFENTVDNMQWVIKFGNVRAVVQEITKMQKQMERAKGGA